MKNANTFDKNNNGELMNMNALVKDLIRERKYMLSAYEQILTTKRKFDKKVEKYSLEYIDEIADCIGKDLKLFFQYAWQTLHLAYRCIKAVKYDLPAPIIGAVFNAKDHYLFVQVIDECFKRLAFIPVEINLSGLNDGKDEFNIKSFQFCNVRYERREVFSTVSDIKHYVMELTEELLDALSGFSS